MNSVTPRTKKRPGNNSGSNKAAAIHAAFLLGELWHTYCMHMILRFLGTAAAVYLTVYLVPGITISGGWVTALLVALVWSVITMVIRPVLSILTLPITIVTLGLFSFILNAVLFWAMTLIVPGFEVAGFVPALIGAVVLSLINWLISKVV